MDQTSGGRVYPRLEYVHPRKKSIDFLGRSCYNKNPGTKKVLECSTPTFDLGQGAQGFGFP